MIINLGRGIDDVYFGVDEQALRQLLGDPDKIDRDSNENPLLIYNSQRCTYWMSDEGQLHWIQTENPQAMLLGRLLIGRSAKSVLAELSAIDIGPIELDDYGSMESYASKNSELEIQVEYGVVSRICFGNLWSEDDEPIYPDA